MHSTKASPAQADAVAAVLEEDALILTIMAHLGARDLATATTVCKAWARLEQEQEERLWERLALDAFGAGEGDGGSSRGRETLCAWERRGGVQRE